MDWTATISKVTAENGLLKVAAEFTPPKQDRVETAVLTYKHWLLEPVVEKLGSVSEDLNKAVWSLDGAIRKLWRDKNPMASESVRVERPDDYPPGFFRLAMGNSLSNGEAEAVYQVPPQPKSRREQEIRRYLTPFNPYCPIPDPKRPIEVVRLRRGIEFEDRAPGGMPIVDPVRLLSFKKDQLANEAVWAGVRSFSIEILTGHRVEIDLSKPYTDHSLTAPVGLSREANSKSEETPIPDRTPQANTRPRVSIVPDPPKRPAQIDAFHHGI